MGGSNLRPIFVGGCQRSGTTLLGSLLGSAPGAIATPETSFRFIVDRASGRGEGSEAALGRMARHSRFEPWRSAGICPDRVSDPACFRDAMEGLVRRYASLHGQSEPRVWIDHTPANVRFALASAEAFPEALFVHVVRDGRAVAASLMRGTWGPNTIRNAARYWLERVSLGIALETSVLAERVVRVRYEELLADPEPTLRRVCAACALEFDPSMLEGGSFDVPRSTRYQHALVGQPPDATRAAAWEEELRPREVEIFEAEAGAMLDLLGYALRHPKGAKRATDLEGAWLTVVERYRKRVANPLRVRRRERALAAGAERPSEPHRSN